MEYKAWLDFGGFLPVVEFYFDASRLIRILGAVVASVISAVRAFKVLQRHAGALGRSKFRSRSVDSASSFSPDFLCPSRCTCLYSGRRKKQNSFTKPDQIGFQSQVGETYDRDTLACERVESRSEKTGAPVFTSSHIDAVDIVLF